MSGSRVHSPHVNVPSALVNFLALLGWAPDGETTIMSRTELIERFSIDSNGNELLANAGTRFIPGASTDNTSTATSRRAPTAPRPRRPRSR